MASGATVSIHALNIENGKSLSHGGGVLNDGVLVVNRTTLTANQSATGGGIRNSSGGDLALHQSTLTGNSATSFFGGGLMSEAGSTLRVNDCTITGNFAQNNGGGIRCNSIIRLKNSIVAGNDATNTNKDLSTPGAGTATLVAEGTNLLSVSDIGGSSFDSGAVVLIQDPMLAPLGGYGGPTRTMPPLFGSPAIDAGGTSNPGGTDQRGFPRFVDGDAAADAALDIGAVEAGTALVVNTAADENDGVETGDVSLRDAVAAATVPLQPILFDAGVFNGEPADTITLAHGQISLSEDLIIDASALTSAVVLSGDANSNSLRDAGDSRIFEVDPDTQVYLRRLSFVNGFADTSDGGAIRNHGRLVVEDSSFANNETSAGGGAISNRSGGQLTVQGSRFVDNRTTTLGGISDGGAIWNAGSGSTLEVHFCSFRTNFAARNGGAIMNQRHATSPPTTTITGSIFENNTAQANGGALANVGDGDSHGVLNVTTSTLVGNKTITQQGGGIDNRGTLTLTLSTLHDNRADGSGGGLRNSQTGGGANSGVATVSEVTFTENQAGTDGTGNGGGILNAGDLTLNNSVVASNAAPVNNQVGGGFTGTANHVSDDEPLLAPLGDYGGPTPTRMPLPGSPVIDAAVGPVGSLDQRGEARINGASADIGSVEAYPIASLGLSSADGDSIPDLLEGPGGPYPHLNPGVDDSALDTDHDGSTDAEEIANMTDLFDPSDSFRITAFTYLGDDGMGAPRFEVTFRSFPGLSYTLQCDQDPAFPNPMDLPFAGPATDSVTTQGVTLTPGGDFLRVQRLPGQ